jgi:hypothetical protein
MTKEIRDKYAQLLIAMSTDYLRDGITWETFVSNLVLIARKIDPEKGGK